jgi:hypothetical protein
MTFVKPKLCGNCRFWLKVPNPYNSTGVNASNICKCRAHGAQFDHTTHLLIEPTIRVKIMDTCEYHEPDTWCPCCDGGHDSEECMCS